MSPAQEDRIPPPHLCSMCKRDHATWDDPAEAAGLWKGTIYNESVERIMPIRAWLCEMHSEQTESGRWVKDNNS